MDLKTAFEKAGLPTASIAFATACHDLARLVLNKQPDPERAVAAALGMMNGSAGFRVQLGEYLAEVAKERVGKPKSDGEAQCGRGAHALNDDLARSSDPNPEAVDQSCGDIGDVLRAGVPASGPNSGDAEDQCDGGDSAHRTPVPASPEHASGGADRVRISGNAHQPNVLPPEPLTPNSDGADHSVISSDALGAGVPPSEARLRALTKSRELSAAVMSGIYITELNGERSPLESIVLSRVPSLVRQKERSAARNVYELQLLRAVERRTPAYSPDGFTIGDVFGLGELNAIEGDAAAVLRGTARITDGAPA